MARALRRLPLETALLLALPATIVAVACSSSWSVGLRDVARPLRAGGVLVVAALAVALAVSRGRSTRVDGAAGCAALAFLALAGASAAWSVDPRHTLARAAAFGLLLATAAALAAAFADDRRGSRRLLAALLAGAAVVALAGLAIAVVSPHDAVQAATASTGARFRGLGQNPNTISMLFAASLPLAALGALEARGLLGRAVFACAFLLLAGSIVGSASRGAAAAAAAGVAVAGLAAGKDRIQRGAVLAGAVALIVTAASVTAVSAPLTPAQVAQRDRQHQFPVGSVEKRTPRDAEYVVRLEDEIGYAKGSAEGRGALSSSGRLDAWKGALGQAVDRPALGYGFGTEEAVFVDRYETFEGGVPENSFIGVLLQLGALGLALFGALLAALALAAFRTLRHDRGLAAVSLGVTAAALVLAVVQSYLYAVGNAATVTVWTCAFLSASRRT